MKLLLLIATLVALSCGYDFSDSEFNQMIFEDLQGYGSDGSRTKRDTESTTDQCHGKWVKNLHCCNGDKIDKVELEKLLEVKHECLKEIWGEDEEPSYDPFNCEQLREVKEQAICLGECISKKKDLLDDKGFVKRDLLIEHLKTTFKETEWKVKTTEAAVDKCLAAFDKTTVEGHKCNPSSMNLVHCLWKEYIQACPKELQSDRWKCKKIREKIEKGDENYLNRVHFFKFIRHHEHDLETEKKDKE